MYGLSVRIRTVIVKEMRMRNENRELRRREIVEHAFDMLARDGYAAFSMQALAKVSKSSKETLYGWFGGKAGLYEAMVEENAARLVLPSADAADGVKELSRFGAELLSMLLGERAVLLNRVAAAEAGGDAEACGIFSGVGETGSHRHGCIGGARGNLVVASGGGLADKARDGCAWPADTRGAAGAVDPRRGTYVSSIRYK